LRSVWMKRSALPFVCGRRMRVWSGLMPLSRQLCFQVRWKHLPLSAQDFFDLDPECLVEAAAVVEEVEGCGGCLLRVGGAVSEPSVVVDADEQVFPAGFAFGAVGPTRFGGRGAVGCGRAA